MKLSKTINCSEIPHSWIFKNYLNINEIFDGTSFKIKSVWNSSEKVPSMIIYFDKDRYRFKDYSSGYSGDGIDLIQYLKHVNFKSAIEIIERDFNEYMNTGNVDFLNHEINRFEYVIDSVKYREWNENDQAYWTQFNIGSELLKKYNVTPLENYTMNYLKNGIVIKQFTFTNTHLYGYHSTKKGLYKIYIPLNKDKKFIKVKSYISGAEQLKFNKENLIMLSSLKDLMAFESLGFKTFEYISPESEGVMLSKEVDDMLSKRYKKKIILFDNDGPGNKYADKYSELFLYRKLTLDMEKDLSDSIKAHGKDSVKERLIISLTNLMKNE